MLQKLTKPKRPAALRLLLLGAALIGQAAYGQSSGTVATIGGALAGFADGNNQVSQFRAPAGLAYHASERLFIADYGNNAVRVMRLSDQMVTTFGPADGPVAVVLDRATNLFVLNQRSGSVTRFDAYGNARGTWISNLAQPTALAIDGTDNLYVAEAAGTIRRFNTNGAAAGTYVVTGAPNLQGVAVFPDGKVAASDAANHVIWIFEKPETAPAVLAGVAGTPGFADGETGVGRLNGPSQIARGLNNSLVVADRLNHRVRVVGCNGAISTLFGIPPSEWETFPDPSILPGWADGDVQFAEVRDPVGVAVSPAGIVYDTEGFYHLVRQAQGMVFPPRCDGTSGGNGNNVEVPLPFVQPGGGFFPNGVPLSVTASNAPSGKFGSDVRLRYTLDGSDPTLANGSDIPLVDGIGTLFIPGPVDLSGLRVRAFIGEASSPVSSGQTTKVPVPILTPNSGYYPMGVSIRVAGTNAFPAGTEIYYTTDGSEPTTNSLAVTIQNGVGTIPWREALRDLRSLRVKPFLGPNVGDTVRGRQAELSSLAFRGQIGIPRNFENEEFFAGIGSQNYVLPIVANLRNDTSLRSIQFVVEIVAQDGAPRLENRADIRILPLSSNDFVQVLPASTNLPNNAFSTVNGPTNRFAIAYIGTNANFLVKEFATVAMIGITFRPGPDSQGNVANDGDRYRVRIVPELISATADGVQDLVPLEPMPERIITLRNHSFLMGDTSPGFWYNAADFGNDVLENGDVNNAIFAGFGFRRPYDFSDAFYAIDVTRDNLIDFTDAETILRRALGFDPNNARRVRDEQGRWLVYAAPQGPPPQNPPLRAASVPPSEVAWDADLTILAGVDHEVWPTGQAAVPVYAKVAPGRSVFGFQFVANVVPQEGAPAVQDVSFHPVPKAPAPSLSGNAVPGIGTLPGTVYARWNNLEPGLSGTVLLGHISYGIPSGARPGHSYIIQFQNCGGAQLDSDGSLRSYSVESVRGSTWVLVSGEESLAVSDEWRTRFFGDATAPEGSPGEDPDGDTFSNYDEYLAGTDPTAANWQTASIGGVFHFRWIGRAGHSYTVEGTSDFRSWTVLSGPLTGEDAFLEFQDSAPSAAARFYRIRIEP